VKNEERNIRPGPVKSIKKSNSFSFVTLFALSGKKKRKKINGINKETNAIKEEEKFQNEEEDKDSTKKIIRRNLSPECKNTHKNKLNILEMRKK
jgi:hypothetical protein